MNRNAQLAIVVIDCTYLRFHARFTRGVKVRLFCSPQCTPMSSGRIGPSLQTGPEEPGARSPSAWLERRNVGLRGNNEQRKSYLSTGGFQLTDQISGWDPEREHTAQNGKCKLLDVR